MTWIGSRPQNALCGTHIFQVTAKSAENPLTWTGETKKHPTDDWLRTEAVVSELLRSARSARPRGFGGFFPQWIKTPQASAAVLRQKSSG